MAPLHFRCARCKADRDYAEISDFSRSSLHGNGPYGKEFLLCRYCLPFGRLPEVKDIKESQWYRNLPATAQATVDKHLYWDSKVTEKELHGKEYPVVEDRLVSYAEAAQLTGVNHNTIASWVFQKKLSNTKVPSGKGPMKAMVRLSDVEKVRDASPRKHLMNSDPKAVARKKPKSMKEMTGTEKRIAKAKALNGRVFRKIKRDGLTMEQAAKAIGVSASALYRMKADHARVHTTAVRRKMEAWAGKPSTGGRAPSKEVKVTVTSSNGKVADPLAVVKALVEENERLKAELKQLEELKKVLAKLS